MYDQQHHSTTSILPATSFLQNTAHDVPNLCHSKKELRITRWCLFRRRWVLLVAQKALPRRQVLSSCNSTSDWGHTPKGYNASVKTGEMLWRMAARRNKREYLQLQQSWGQDPRSWIQACFQGILAKVFFFNEIEHWIRKNHAKSWSTTWNFYETIHPKYLKNQDKSGLFQLFPIPKRPCWPGKKVLYRGHRVPESHLQHFHRIAFQQWMEGTWLHRSVNSQPFSRLQSAEKIQKSKIIISVSATAQKLFGLQNHLQ